MRVDTPARAAYIRHNLEVRAPPFAPELRYYGAHQRSALSRMSDAIGDNAPDLPPYWAYLWPGGASLVQYLQACPEAVAGKRVLDFGAGGGVLAIKALQCGAASAICADNDPTALIACELNAQLNGVELTAMLCAAPVDWPDIDVVLAGDIYYDASVAQAATGALSRCAKRGIPVWVGDIARDWLPGDRLEEIAAYPVHDIGGAASDQVLQGRVFRWLD